MQKGREGRFAFARENVIYCLAPGIQRSHPLGHLPFAVGTSHNGDGPRTLALDTLEQRDTGVGLLERVCAADDLEGKPRHGRRNLVRPWGGHLLQSLQIG